MATQRIYSAEEAVKRLNELPPEAHEFIYGQEWGDILNKIGDKNSLHLDQLGTLEYETAALVLGFTEPTDFTKIISENLTLSPEAANIVATDVNELLLSKIRKNMMSVNTPEKTQVVQIKEPVVNIPEPSILPSLQASSELPSSVNTTLSEPATQIASTISIPGKPIASENKEVGPASTNKYKIDPYREPIE